MVLNRAVVQVFHGEYLLFSGFSTPQQAEFYSLNYVEKLKIVRLAQYLVNRSFYPERNTNCICFSQFAQQAAMALPR